VAPPNSFVDVSKFPSPRDLALHLKKVAKDPLLSSQYRAWRKEGYKVVAGKGWVSENESERARAREK